MPNNDIEYFEALLLQTSRHIKDIMICATDPNCAVGFEYLSASGNPFGVEVVDLFGSSCSVPLALVKIAFMSVFCANIKALLLFALSF